MLVIAAVIVAIVAAVPYALALLLYSFPFFLLWMLVQEEIGPEPQLVVDTSTHKRLAELRAQLRYANEQWTHVRYNDWGIRWSDNLDRFDERAIRGRELNLELKRWETDYVHLRDEIDEMERPERKALEQWSKTLQLWYAQHAMRTAKTKAWKFALFTFAGVWVLGELWAISSPDAVKLFSFAWNPSPDIFHPGLAMGAVAAWAIGFYMIKNPPEEFRQLADEKIEAYASEKQSREEEEDSRTTYSYDKYRHNDKRDEVRDTPDQGLTWHQVLKVDAQSSIEEIKAAYKKAAMACHPDKVAYMNEHIQQVAKEEMQKLNEAFQQAQLSRGF